MYVASCPNCAHPSPVSLARPDVTTCPACGFSGGLPPEIQARLHAAGEVLKGIDVRHRQLTGRQKSILGSGCGFTVILFVVAGVLMLPALFWAAVSVGMAIGAETVGDRVMYSVLGLSPLGVLLMGVTVSYLLLRRVRQRLKAACAASPPIEGSTTARCRVCSAELTSSGEAVVRCEFCDADNVVEADVVSSVAKAQHQVLEGFEQVVVESGLELHKAARRGIVAIVVSLVAAPFLAFLFTVIAYGALTLVERPANFELRYALVDTSAGQCLAKVGAEDGGTYSLSFGPAPPPGQSESTRRDNLDGLEVVTARWLIGRNVRSFYYSEPFAGRVEAITGDLTGENNYTDLNGWTVPIEGLCLIPDEPQEPRTTSAVEPSSSPSTSESGPGAGAEAGAGGP